MDLIKKNNKNWWSPAVLVFSEISTWIAFPIILALFAGKALDEHYGTKPWIFLGFACLGFFISSYGIVKTVKKFMAKMKREEENKKEKSI